MVAELTSPMPPTEPSPDGWRQPTTPPGRHETYGLLLLGFFLSGGMSWVTIQAIGNAWSACDDLGLGGGGLVIVFFPILTLVALAGFAVGLVLTRHEPSAIRLACGLVVALAICVTAAALWVPAYGEASYESTRNPDLPECGPNGIPTWWPSWLPS
jgi:hypothetical protein